MTSMRATLTKKFSRYRMQALILGIALAMTACAGSTDEPGTGPAAQSDAADGCSGPPESEEVSFMAHYLAGSYFGPIIAADKAKLFEKQGLTVDIEYPANPENLLQYVASGRKDIAVSFMPTTIMAREQGIPVVSVAAFNRILDVGIASLSSANITSPADLKGKTIAMTPKPEAIAYLKSMLATAGLTIDDVTVVNPGYGTETILLEKKADAAYSSVTNSLIPIRRSLREKNSTEKIEFMPFTEHGVPALYYYVLVSNEQWAAENKNTICHFLVALEGGLKLFSDDPTAKPALDFMTQKNSVFTADDHTSMRDAYLENGAWKAVEGGTAWTQEEELWKTALTWARDRGLVDEVEDPATYFTNASMPQR